ncbi:MAG: hypothetical protein JRC90_10540 [Deltaproteobacteria bacterium]|nr:hypothetical protein [Deltaproteobacteria bacterium]
MIWVFPRLYADWRTKKAPIPERVIQPSVVVMLLAGIIVVSVALWNEGTFLFYIFVDIYTALFY